MAAQDARAKPTDMRIADYSQPSAVGPPMAVPVVVFRRGGTIEQDEREALANPGQRQLDHTAESAFPSSRSSFVGAR